MQQWIKQQLLDLANVHLMPRDQLLKQQNINLTSHLERLTEKEKIFWLGSNVVESIVDLQQLPIRTDQDIIAEQLANPPYGIWLKNSVIFTSSKSTQGIRKTFSRSLDDYWRFIASPARSLLSHKVDQSDTILTTDTGNMFSGHLVIEDAATMICGATRVRIGDRLLTNKLQAIKEYGVTVLSASPAKLLRMAMLDPKKYQTRPMKMIISTGGKLENPEFIAEAFGVERITNLYGMAEFCNIAWTCSHGHWHVNEDFVHIEQGKYFTNLINLSVFRYQPGESLTYSYKGTCSCGSNLSTVDKFETNNEVDRSRKD
jgi:phenylacetate-coenzyme A ligase PaaK-like adenylate-forming protein